MYVCVCVCVYMRWSVSFSFRVAWDENYNVTDTAASAVCGDGVAHTLDDVVVYV